MAFWDDLIIGEGHKGNSAIIVRKCGEVSISHNSVSFWVSNAYLDTGLTIFKDTEEGMRLTRDLRDSVPDVHIENWLAELVVRVMPVDRLKAKISSALGESFDAGRQFQAAKIRSALQGD